MEESFKPSPNMLRVYYTYISLAVLPLAVLGLLVVWLVSGYHLTAAHYFAVCFFVPLAIVACFVLYWAPKYYRSIDYRLTGEEVVVEHGVWWKIRHTVPYSRVMSVDTIQGPISRRFGVATVDVYTAGYTGVAGGSGGPSARRAEASILYVSNFTETREKILGMVRGRSLFASRPGDVGTEIIAELRRIREALKG